MLYSPVLQTYIIGNQSIQLFVPDPVRLKKDYKKQSAASASLYWAKVWPAAIGLCYFLQDNPHYITNKKVLELAAGPGLPGIFAASLASSVCISDIEPAAITLMQQSVTHHQLNNVSCKVIDWNNLANEPIPDTVLLSDINYEPAQFKNLLQAIEYLLNKQCTIILSTPQRLVAKEFINQLLVYCIEQSSFDVELDNKETAVSVFVLKK